MAKLFLALIIVFIISVAGFLVYKDTHKTEILSGGLTRSLPTANYQLPTLTLDSIFNSDHSWVDKLDPNKTITLIATGDVIPARTVNFLAVNKVGFDWSYKNISNLTRSGDITFVNLETPLIQKCAPTTEGMTFCGDPRHVQGLLELGADVANLGNNHAGNYGVEGVKETVDLLNKNNIETTGVNGPVYKEIKGIKFAFLGYDDITLPQPGVSNFDENKLKNEINEARKNADIVIVQYHWGVEYRAQPDDRQKMLGHLTIDDGADLVIGNHPHWIQPVEFYKDHLITYAHGNTIFDQMWSEETKYGVIGKYTFFDKKLVDVQYFPLYIKDYGQPSLLTGESAQKVLNNMKNQSEILATNSGSI